MNTKIFSATLLGLQTHLVDVEVDLSFGLINFFIVGLPDAAIKESRQRIQTALKNSGIKFPEKKITVNLAPAHLKKEGTLFDLPIAIGILQAAQYLQLSPTFLKETLFIGELSLNGSIKPIIGALPIACDAQNLKKKRIILPQENAQEASLIHGIEVIGVSSLIELLAFLKEEKAIAPTIYIQTKNNEKNSDEKELDFADVRGQEFAKRALQIAAAGYHNILFIGPPGAGKTMIAKRLKTIMPSMTFEETIETTKIYSIANKLNKKSLLTERPFCAPHHTISQAGLIGGGTFPKPGQVSLSHNGVLFLDELTEFKKDTLEALRQPLEEHEVIISRAQQTVSYPASFLLVAALNPCPCGYKGDKNHACSCSPLMIQKYMKKLSGPLLDRIDLKIMIQSVSYEDATSSLKSTSSAELQEKVAIARNMQYKRFFSFTKNNSRMSSQEVDSFCTLDTSAKILLEKAFTALQMSMRSYHKTLKVARTIADLEASDKILEKHIKEAILYKN